MQLLVVLCYGCVKWRAIRCGSSYVPLSWKMVEHHVSTAHFFFIFSLKSFLLYAQVYIALSVCCRNSNNKAAIHAGPPHRLWRFTAWENRWKKEADIIVMPTLATAATAQTSWFHHQVIETAADSPTTPRNCWTNFYFWVSRPIFFSRIHGSQFG